MRSRDHCINGNNGCVGGRSVGVSVVGSVDCGVGGSVGGSVGCCRDFSLFLFCL